MKNLSRWEKFVLVMIASVLLGGATITGCGMLGPLPERVHADLPVATAESAVPGEPTLADLLRMQAQMVDNIAKMETMMTQLVESNRVVETGLSTGEMAAGGTGAAAIIFSILQLVRSGVHEERRKNLASEITWQQEELVKLQAMIDKMRGLPTAVPPVA